MKALAVILLAIFAIALPPDRAEAQTLQKESEKLAYCESVYLYAAQYLQIIGKEGAAKNVLARAARTTSANFMANEVDGVIAKEKIKQWRDIGRQVKPRFDPNPESVLNEVDVCHRDTNDLINAQIRSKKQLWGKSFPDLQAMMLNQYMNAMGIK
jgi:hypothetical protein